MRYEASADEGSISTVGADMTVGKLHKPFMPAVLRTARECQYFCV